MFKWVGKVLGSDANERELKKLWPIVERVSALEPEVQALSDDELRAKTDEFRCRLAEGETLDDLLVEGFAVAREAIRRAVGERAFDVQVLGGIILHQGKIAEMKTGEGKTLVATLPFYLNALEGKGTHLVTVNDYLAKRDAQWYGRALYNLGLNIGVLQHDSAYVYTPEKVSEVANMEHLMPAPRRRAYQADVTYGTNNEFGFDYLRDNMAVDLSYCVQRELHYAIVDEVDNILIDEARTPLIISGPAAESTQIYYTFARLVPRLAREIDYTVDERMRAVSLTEQGMVKIEQGLGVKNIYAPEHYRLTRYMEAALKAQILYHRDHDYVVRDNEVIIVDDFTGRLMLGRRWSDGLHQAVEAKEGVKIQQETVTYATITIQNYFRLYDKLAGMTGTAWTEREEIYTIYGLDVAVIPTDQPMIREDHTDLVYRTEEGKFQAVQEEIEELHRQGRPVLVGTVSIERSEYLSEMLRRKGIPHEVLNAKHHEKEAAIITQAGHKGAVTIATNMAGRGTDIILGGKPDGRPRQEWEQEHNEVVAVGGLQVIGTERHEARRIDNQLRGRSGRQGDPGSSRFYVSFEDELMRRFAPEWLPGMMERLGMEENIPIEHSWVSRAIETAQTKVEGYNFDIRKHVVEYDDVMNTQRDVIYTERRKILEGADLKANIMDMLREEITALWEGHLPERQEERWDYDGLFNEVSGIVRLPSNLAPQFLARLSRDDVLKALISYAEEVYERKESEMGSQTMRTLERLVMLRTIDSLWVEHLTAMEEMRQGIGLHAYGQADPRVVYKKEARDMWDQFLANIRHQITHSIYHVELAPSTPAPARQPAAVAAGRGAGAAAARAGTASSSARDRRPVTRKVGRNDPCPCGSGKKYKKCHGMAA